MRADRWLLAGLLLALVGCGGNGDPELLGTLEWDRVGIPAEASETILRWDVAEGDQVKAGQLLLELDPRRLDAQVAQARGGVAQARARLDELSNGARSEDIDAARATLNQDGLAGSKPQCLLDGAHGGEAGKRQGGRLHM